MIELLLGSDINVNQKNMLGMSAFLLAAGYGNEKLVHMILQAGADPKATNDFGNNAIHIAVVGKQVSCHHANTANVREFQPLEVE